jgi:hypothetical protein
MRVHDVEEGLTDLGEVVVDPSVHPGGQKGETLQEALDMGVVAPVGFQPQGFSDFLVLGAELGPEATEESQLLFVIFL